MAAVNHLSIRMANNCVRYFCLVKRRRKREVVEHLAIEDYAAEGKSLGRMNGKVVFVEGVVPGDVADVLITKSKADWAEGVALRIHEYAADRVTPFCKHFGVCGGCQWQMLPYEKQLYYKQKQVADSLSRIGKIDVSQMKPIAGCDEILRYRNKLEYTFSNKKYLTAEEYKNADITDLENVAGFHPKGFFDKVVEIDVCHLQHAPTNEIRKAIARFGIEHGYTFYDIRRHTGFLRTMQVRTATTGELMVNVVFAENTPARIEALFDFLLKEFPQITTLLYTINTKKNDSLFDLQPVVYFGKGYIVETLENFQFKISPKSFFQTNSRQAEVLYRLTRDMACLTGNEVVYDLYCGTGSIGIFVSKMAKAVVGVEVVEDAIADANENVALNNIGNAKFFSGDVSDFCTEAFFEAHGKPDVIITDPPRAGMHPKLIDTLLEIAAPLIVYVSCNPATQARDVSLLSTKYAVTAIQPVDMFPHTLHIENIVQLRLK